MTYHPTVQRILDLLRQHKAWHETFEHEPVRTSEEASRTRTGYTLEQGAKALIVRVKTAGTSKHIMLVFPAHRRFDSKKVKAALQVKDIRFATEEEVSQITQGVQVGGVPPFGHLFQLETYVDPSLFEHENIVFNAGDRSFSIGMKAEDYKRIEQPTLISLTEDVSSSQATTV